MKLSTKLVITFFVIVFMPILLALFAFFVIRLIQMNAVAQQTGIDIGVLAYKIDMSQIEVLVEDMAICIVLILAATGLSITAWIYRSIVTPICRLEEAAKNIKEGNLNFTVEADSNDEMGSLCRNFEDMRQRLKDCWMKRMQASTAAVWMKSTSFWIPTRLSFWSPTGIQRTFYSITPKRG